MGTWGSGNFDNDGAADFLAEEIQRYCSRIDEVLKEGVELDDNGEDILMPCVQIVLTLCENLESGPPKSKKIQNWKKQYLEAYDEQIEGLDPSEGFAEERREVIESTFDQLLKLAEESEK